MTCYSECHTDPGHNGCGSMEEIFGPDWRHDLERENRYRTVKEAWLRFLREVDTFIANNPSTSIEEYEGSDLYARGERFRKWFRANKEYHS